MITASSGFAHSAGSDTDAHTPRGAAAAVAIPRGIALFHWTSPARLELMVPDTAAGTIAMSDRA
jgi:hypothetical protein